MWIYISKNLFNKFYYAYCTVRNFCRNMKINGEIDRGYIIWKNESRYKNRNNKNIETYSFICKVFKWNETSSFRIVKIIHDRIIHDIRQIDRPHYHKRKISFEEMKRVQKLYYLKILRSYSRTNNPL